MTPREALVVAQIARLARAEAKRQLASGRASLPEVIDTGCCDTMPIGQLLNVIPWWGPVRGRRLLKPLGLDPEAQIGTLTPRQRDFLFVAYRREMTHMSNGRRKRKGIA